MINADRIVPVTQVDLLTLYGNIMKLAGTTVTAASIAPASALSSAKSSTDTKETITKRGFSLKKFRIFFMVLKKFIVDK